MILASFLEGEFLRNAMMSWMIAAGVFFGLLAALETAKGVIIHKLGKIADKTDNELDDTIIGVARSTKHPFILVFSAYVALEFVTLPPSYEKMTNWIAVGALFLQSVFWCNQIIELIISHFVRREEKRSGEENLALRTSMAGFRLLLRFILYSILLLVALDNLGVNISALLTGLGVGGIAVALAVQSMLGDLFASLSIMFDKPFVVGDFIIVGDMMGTVEKIGLKTTRIRSLSGEQLVFSNNDLLSSRIRNYKRMEERRIAFTLGVTYQTTQDKLKKIPEVIKRIIDQQENARFDRCHFKSFGAFSLDFETVYYVSVPDYNTYMDIQQAINLTVYEEFGRDGIEFAYPTQTLFLEKEAELGAA